MHPYVHSSTIYNRQDMEQPKCPSTDEWIKKIWPIYAMEYYSAIKKNEIMPFAANYIQYRVINHNEKNMKKNVYICITESLCCTAEINTTLQINYT